MIIPINFVVEDDPSEAILEQILKQSGRPYVKGGCYGKKGFGYIRKKIFGFSNAAKGTPFLVLTDLDAAKCAPSLIKNWIGKKKLNPNLLFRIAVREVESWIMAHREAFSDFFGIKAEAIPDDTDSIEAPKQFLIELARRSTFRSVRESIVPTASTTAKVGRGYNSVLSEFIYEHWKIKTAISRSRSLKKAVDRIKKFKPQIVKEIK